MASTSKQGQPSTLKPSKGPAGLVVVGNLADMIEAANTNPHMAKALDNARTMRKKEAQTGSEENVDLGHCTDLIVTPPLELWKEAMRFEANRDGAEEAFERTLAKQLAGIELGEELPTRANTAASGPKGFAGSTSDQDSSSAHARETGLGNVASRWLGALGEAEQEKTNQADDPDSENPAKAADSISTAQILQYAVLKDIFPTDPLTREHFGFSKVNSYEEETCLLGLYQGLLKYLPSIPSVETVQGWQQKNKLAGGIYHCYKSQDANSGYFRWFKRNQHLFSQDYKRPEGVWAPMERPTSIDPQTLHATCHPKRNNKRGKS